MQACSKAPLDYKGRLKHVRTQLQRNPDEVLEDIIQAVNAVAVEALLLACATTCEFVTARKETVSKRFICDLRCVPSPLTGLTRLNLQPVQPVGTPAEERMERMALSNDQRPFEELFEKLSRMDTEFGG